MTTTKQWTRADLDRAYRAGRYDDIDRARRDGSLNVLLGGIEPNDPDAHLTVQDVQRLYAEGQYDAIAAAAARGLITYPADATTEGN